MIPSSACFSLFLQIVSDNVLKVFMFCKNCSHTDTTTQESLSKIFAAFSFHDCTLTERKARLEFGSRFWVFRFCYNFTVGCRVHKARRSFPRERRGFSERIEEQMHLWKMNLQRRESGDWKGHVFTQNLKRNFPLRAFVNNRLSWKVKDEHINGTRLRYIMWKRSGYLENRTRTFSRILSLSRSLHLCQAFRITFEGKWLKNVMHKASKWGKDMEIKAKSKFVQRTLFEILIRKLLQASTMSTLLGWNVLTNKDVSWLAELKFDWWFSIKH